VIAAEWDRLAQKCQSPLYTNAWFHSCAKAFCPENELHIIVMEMDGELSAIAPMRIRKRAGIRFCEFIGASDLYEPSGLIYKNSDCLTSLVKDLLARKKSIIFSRMDDCPDTLEAIRSACRNRGIVISRKMPNSLVFKSDSTCATFEDSLSLKTNRKIRRKMKQAQKFGKVTFEVVTPTRNNLDDFLQELYDVENSGWKKRTGTSIKSQPEMQAFLENYAASCIETGALRMCVMRINAKPVAVKMAVVNSNKLWEIKIGYDEEYAKCSPGILLTHEALRYVFEENFDGYEFLGEEEEWEHMWTREQKSYFSVHVYPYSLSGITSLAREGVLFFIKKIKSATSS